MKKTVLKYISLCLCAVLIISSAGAAVYALTNDKASVPSDEKEETASVAANEEEPLKNTKDETVYVLAGADGSVQKIIVSDWIKNALGSSKLNDKSELADAENVKGDETYTMNGENIRVWDADGNDVYYQGNIKKELPVDMSVSYTLDGKSISASELAGKSGHAVIRFDYKNNQYETVEIDGKEEKIYVPFAMLTGMLLDADTFRNVDVSNGKIINDGSHIAVVGIAFPGLQENLAIDREKLEFPEYVEISADVTDFKMTTTMTIAANNIFNQIDSEKLDSADSLKDSVGEMSEAVEKLIDGSSQLYDGLCTLLDKSSELIDGINRLADGASALKSGAYELDSGAEKLEDGAARLSDGLDTLKANNGSLNGGAKQVFETLLSTAGAQISASGITVPALTIDNYSDVLNGTIASLDKNKVYEAALAQVTAAVESNRALIESKVTAAVQEQVAAKVTAAVQEAVENQVTAAVRENVASQVIAAATDGKMTKEAYEAALAAGAIDAPTQAAIEGEIASQMSSEQVKALIAQNTASQMESDSVKAVISAKTAEQMQSGEVKNTVAENVGLQIKQAISENMASEAVQSKLKAADDGAKSLISLKVSLDSYNAFYLGLLSYTNGVAEAADGAGELKAGAADLKAGSARLADGAANMYDGILKLTDGAPALKDGVTKLRDGSLKLTDGLKEFNEQGIQKLADAVDGNLSSLVTRLRASVDVSRNYKSFTGLGDDMDGQVKFIYRTEAVKKAD